MEKEQLKDVTFLLIAKFDSMERLENTIYVVNFLNACFETNIKLWVYGLWNNKIINQMLPTNIDFEFHEDFDPIFYRTHFLNNMIETVDTKYISVWDVDVIICKEQIVESMNRLRNGCDVVYPYDVFFDTTDELRRLFLSSNCNFDILTNYTKYMIKMYEPIPVGGVYIISRECYVNSGKENENYYGWGYEDGDRYYRWMNLHYKIERIRGPLFHLSHPRGINSTEENSELELIKKRELFNTIRNRSNE